MQSQREKTFWLPPAWRWVSLAALMLAAAPLLAIPIIGVVLLFLLAIGGAWVLGSYYTVSVLPDGLLLYRVWWLPWVDVAGVVYSELFGIGYFSVTRKSGLTWWIPLYFVGDGDLRQTIAAAAPPGHAFRLA